MRSEHSCLGNQAFGPEADELVRVEYESHATVLQELRKVIDDGRNIGLLCGPQSSGKTVIVRQLSRELRKSACVITIDGASTTPLQVTTELLSELDCRVKLQSTAENLKLIRAIVIHRYRMHSAPVLFIENIDRMMPTALHILCLLADFTTLDRLAIRMILTGRNQSRAVIASQEMVDVARRTSRILQLGALSRQESMTYLYARLLASGVSQPDGIFPIDVCDRLYEQSGGWPGLLNEYALQAIEQTSQFPLRASGIFEEPELQPALRGTDGESPQKQLPNLIVTVSGRTVHEFAISEGKTIIGRSKLADVKIDDDYVSKFHAMLMLSPGGLVIADLNSSNGTFVNSKKIASRILNDNDIISVGHFRIKVENASVASDERLQTPDQSDTARMKTLADQRALRIARAADAAAKGEKKA